MINLYSVDNVKLGLLENLKDFVIVDKLKNGNSTLSFSLYRNDPYCKEINEECYIETFDNRYIVKSINNQQTVIRYNCELDLESLTSKIWKDGFSNTRATVLDTVKLAIAGAGWTVASQNLTDKKRSINLKATDSFEIIKSCLVKWDVEVKFDAKNRVIILADKVGEDKGVYFSDELNLTTINIEGESKNFATRLYVRGKDGLTFASLNGGKDYIEDFTYTNKIVSKIWIDERYESSEQLLEDSKLKLNDYCRPKVTYELEIVDLASLSENYSFLEYGIGDSVTLLSVDKELREVHRIVELMRYPLEPERNTATLSNGQLTFEEAQEKNESMAEDIDSVLNEDGTLNGSKVDGITTNQIIDFEAQVGSVVDFTAVNAKIENLQANKASIGQLSAVQADIGDLRANTATIDQLNATNAKITTLESDNIKVNGLLEASSAQIKVLEADTATIKHLVNGNLSSENIQAGGITSDKLTIANGFIKNAMIDKLDVNKINAGIISTSKFKIASEDGGIEIVGATQQFKDKNNKVRIQMGRDTQNNFNFILKGEDGSSVLIDSSGIKKDAIADDLIVSDMIAPDAVGSKNIDYNSFSTGFNESTNTNTLKATKIKLDNTNQTLEVGFNKMDTSVKDNTSKTTANTTAINVQQGKIDTLISDTTIVKDGKTTKLKDEYSKTEQTVSGLSTTVGKQQTTIDDHTGKITSTNSEISTLKQNVDGISANVSSAQTTIQSHTALIGQKANSVDVYTKTQTDSQINIAKDAINLGVSSTYETKTNVDTKISNVQIGSFNLLEQSTSYLAPYWSARGTCPATGEYYRGSAIYKINTPWHGRSYMKAALLKLEPTVQYVYSFYAKRDANAVGTNGSFYLYGTTTGKVVTSLSNITTEWKRYSVVVTGAEVNHAEANGLRLESSVAITGGYFYLCGFQLERGNKATDWSPNIDDFDTKVNNAKAELNDTIGTKASKTDVYVKTETYSKTEADSKINIAKDAITSSVASTYETKTDVTSKINGVNSSISSLQTRMSSAESKITEDSITNTVKKNFYTKTETEGQITSKGYQTASQVQQKVDSVAFNFQESGGYNLIPNSRWENDWWNWANHAGNNATIIRDTATNLPYVRTAMTAGVNNGSATVVKLEKGRTYTASTFVDLETNAQAGIEMSFTDASGTKRWIGTNTLNSKQFRNNVLFWTFTMDVSTDVSIMIYSYGNRTGATSGGFCRFRWVQLEQGSSHHQWSPHPYEVYQGQTSINKNGIRVNASNVATYTEMHAGGFFVKQNNGNIIFGATDTIRLYGPNNVKAFEVRRVENAAYGNATIEICGGINFIHKPGVSVGTNGFMLGNDDRSNAYGYHNLSIKCWNSMGIADNNNLTNMFLDARRGRWIMKGAVYQNTQTPPAAYKLSNNENSELFSGYTVSDITDSILGLYTTIKVDSDEDYTMMILPSGNDLVTTMIDNQPHIDHSSVVAGLVEVVKKLDARNKELELRIEKIEDQKNKVTRCVA